MKASEAMQTARTPVRFFAQRLTRPLGHWFRGRTGLIVATALVGAGTVLNWNWLVAAGFAPIILSVVPCLAMCALGIACMRGGGHKSCSTKSSAEDSATLKTPSPEPPATTTVETAARSDADQVGEPAQQADERRDVMANPS